MWSDNQENGLQYYLFENTTIMKKWAHVVQWFVTNVAVTYVNGIRIKDTC